jgi:hypothetical protein
MVTMEKIEKLTGDTADARERLAETVRTLEDKMEALKRQYLPGIKVQVGIAAQEKADLEAAIKDSKELFKRPRTVIISGIRVGLAKGKGKIEIEKGAADHIVALIEKYFPEQAEILIKTKKTPVKSALDGLSASELKKLGIQVEDTGDQVVIKPTDSQIEKLVDKLLKEKDEETEEDAA